MIFTLGRAGDRLAALVDDPAEQRAALETAIESFREAHAIKPGVLAFPHGRCP
jgi:hypothetical protein